MPSTHPETSDPPSSGVDNPPTPDLELADDFIEPERFEQEDYHIVDTLLSEYLVDVGTMSIRDESSQLSALSDVLCHVTDVFKNYLVLFRKKDSLKLIRSNQSLREKLLEACASRSFRDITRIEILRKSATDFNWILHSRENEERAIKNAWNAPFKGNAASALLDVFNKYMKLPVVYWNNISARYLTIVQSSGTGKSRVIDEISKTTLVIPINLRGGRGSDDDIMRYPPADLYWEFSLNLDTQRVQVATRTYAFLASLFKITLLRLTELADKCLPQTVDINSRRTALANKFRTYMAEGSDFSGPGYYRSAFHLEVQESARILWDEWHQSGRADTTFASSQMVEHARLLTSFLEPSENMNRVEGLLLTVAFDHAHHLTTSAKASPAATAAPVLLNQNGQLMSLPPFTELGFDHFAIPVSGDGSTTVGQVSSDEFMATLGRPLFAAQYNGNTYYMKHFISGLAQVTLLSRPKLLSRPTETLMPHEPQSLACLSVRLPLEFSSSTLSRRSEHTLVERHLRCCIMGDSADGVSTLAPSEPLLAEAAAGVMRNFISEASGGAPGSLLRHMQESSPCAEGRERLVAALLLLLARDLTAHSEPVISVAGLFDGLLASPHAETVRGALPSRVLHRKAETAQATLEETFEKSFVYFNHFIKVNDLRVLHREYLWRLVVRGAALICANGQRGVDIAIPFLYEGGKIMKTNISAILIQVKNDELYCARYRPSVFDLLDPFSVGLYDTGEEPLPVIRMIFALSAPHPTVEVSQREEPHLGDYDPYTAFDIWCAGVSPEVFRTISRWQIQTYRELLHWTSNGYDAYDRKDYWGDINEVLRGETTRLTSRRMMNPGSEIGEVHWRQFIGTGSAQDQEMEGIEEDEPQVDAVFA
ncbi:hypothetical protein BV25DRAFT_1988884 [Artomyces pyxidatus]|uniref:Uncharacterized protein n=1 Tax=Artomyces pyxidatus TaxID=48021 RepID=A0ACB8TAF3_9AGAM|nr:hypothetical protein BV25DRAFT_1988884 [Artomyces pyxidatus]